MNNKKHKSRFLKKDYQAKGLKNPFFRVKKKKTHRYLKFRFILYLLLAFVIIWFFWFSPVFSIKSIKVEGLNRVNPGLIEQMAWQQANSSRYLVFKQNNIFIFDEESLLENLNLSNNFSKLEIFKNIWSRKIYIKISERPYAFIWQEGNSYYFSDQGGSLIKDELVSEEHKKQFLILENRSGNSLILDDRDININENYLPFIFKLAEAISKNPDFKVKVYFIDNELNTVKLALDNGPEIYFSTREEPLSQFNKLLVIKRESIKDTFNKLKYIDLRYKDKVYYQ